MLGVAPGYRYHVDPTDLVALLLLPLAVGDGLRVIRRAEARGGEEEP